MPQLDAQTFKDIVGLLTPFMDTEDERQAILDSVFVGHATRPDIDLSGAPEAFTRSMIHTLIRFGEIEPGEQSLSALLRFIREQVGVDKQRRIDGWIAAANTGKRSTFPARITPPAQATGPRMPLVVALIGAAALVIAALIAILPGIINRNDQQASAQTAEAQTRVFRTDQPSTTPNQETLIAEVLATETQRAAVVVGAFTPTATPNLSGTARAAANATLTAAALVSSPEAFTPNSFSVIDGSNAIRLAELRRMGSGRGRIYRAVYAPDGKTIAVVGTLGVWLYDVHNLEAVPRLFDGHTEVVTNAAWSEDSRYLVSSSGDTSLILWEVATGQPLRTLRGHQSWVTSVAWSPETSTLSRLRPTRL